MEPTVFVNRLLRLRVLLVVTLCNGFATEQNLVVLAKFDFNLINEATDRA